MKSILRVTLLVLLSLIFFQANVFAYDFFDDFSTDTIGTPATPPHDDYSGNYDASNTWGSGGTFSHDAAGERASVLTPSGVGVAFTPRAGVTAMTSGSFGVYFQPTAKNGDWGAFSIRLMQDATNYYEICNADGDTTCNGVKGIRKVVGGVEELSAAFASDYVQGTDYEVRVSFTPTQVKVNAYGEVLVFDTVDTTAISVTTFEIDSAQQDAYYDNIVYGDSAPTAAITAPATDSTYDKGDSVTFTGTADDILDGDISADLSWSSSLDGALGTGATFATSSLSGGTHTITASITDSDGLQDSTTIRLTVKSFPWILLPPAISGAIQ